MVFGLFSRKQPLAPPESAPSSSSPSVAPPPQKSPRMPQSNLPASPSKRARQLSPARPAGQSTSVAIVSTPAFIPPEATVQSLTSHLVSIPAKTLHSYVLAHVPRAPEPVLSSLATFFSELAPPQRMHCVRCHKDYVEVENDDRSCLVPHDDESAEVERVGRGAKSGRPAGDPGTTYETLWGCCGKITEGKGDQGPPDGWCYEGKHTMDIKRARFRADSTPYDDKLTSCLRLNCHGIRDQLPRAALRKRRRSMNLKESNTDEDDGSEGEVDSGMDEIVDKTKGKSKGKGKAKDVTDEQMDVDQDTESASRAGSTRGRARGRPKVSSNAQSGAPKRRGRPPKAKALPQETTDADGVDADVDDTASVKSTPVTGSASAMKRRGRKPKSKAYIEDSDMEMEQDWNRNADERRNGPRTRSLSRTRASVGGSEQKPLSVDASARRKPKSKARKSKGGDEHDGKAGEGSEDELPKKKRRVAA